MLLQVCTSSECLGTDVAWITSLGLKLLQKQFNRKTNEATVFKPSHNCAACSFWCTCMCRFKLAHKLNAVSHIWHLINRYCLYSSQPNQKTFWDISPATNLCLMRPICSKLLHLQKSTFTYFDHWDLNPERKQIWDSANNCLGNTICVVTLWRHLLSCSWWSKQIQNNQLSNISINNVYFAAVEFCNSEDHLMDYYSWTFVCLFSSVTFCVNRQLIFFPVCTAWCFLKPCKYGYALSQIAHL